jgi:hypothetical protein
LGYSETKRLDDEETFLKGEWVPEAKKVQLPTEKK